MFSYSIFLTLLNLEIPINKAIQIETNLKLALKPRSQAHHKGEEIDLVALNESTKEIAFLECKWSKVNEKEAEKILADLKRKAMLVNGTIASAKSASASSPRKSQINMSYVALAFSPSICKTSRRCPTRYNKPKGRS